MCVGDGGGLQGMVEVCVGDGGVWGDGGGVCRDGGYVCRGWCRCV